MRPATALCLLAAFAFGVSSLCNRRLPARRRQALSPTPLRRRLTPTEAVELAVGRAAAEVDIAARWQGLTPEDVARLAMAWPAFTPLVSTRKQ